MRFNQIQRVTLSLVVITVLAGVTMAADGDRAFSSATAIGAIESREMADASDPESTVARDTAPAVSKAAPATQSKPKSGANSSALGFGKHEIQVRPAADSAAPKTRDVATKGREPASKAVLPNTPEATPQTKQAPEAADAESIAVEAASFKGVTPGVSTKEDVAKAWGAPKEIAKQNDGIIQLYSVAPFSRVEVSYSDDKVASIIVRLDRPYPAEIVAKQLGLSGIRSVRVCTESGNAVGLAFPERGVSFAFEADKETGKPTTRVLQIVLDPISAEPFVLRAETTIETRADLSCSDAEQALALEPNNAKAIWLHARALAALEKLDNAAAESARAIQLDSTDCRYRTTDAQILAQQGRLPEALAQAKKAVELSGKQLHLKARALCLVGDLTAIRREARLQAGDRIPRPGVAACRFVDEQFESCCACRGQGSAC